MQVVCIFNLMAISLSTLSNIGYSISTWFQQSLVNGVTQWAGSLTGLGLIVVGLVILLAGRKVIDAVTLLIAIVMILFGVLELFGFNVLKVIEI